MTRADEEELFSRWEGAFASKVFHPHLTDGICNVRYEEWLRRFAVSLAWRTGVVTKDAELSEPLTAKLNSALETWRKYLLDLAPSSGPYSHHLFYLPHVREIPRHIPVPDHLNWYLMRTVDATLAYSHKAVHVFTKLPGFAFWSAIHPPEARGWIHTRILKKGECGSPIQRVDDKYFGDFLLERARYTVGTLQTMSARQHELIRSQYLKHADLKGVDPSVISTLSADRALGRRRRPA
jgi:hypothetical protein